MDHLGGCNSNIFHFHPEPWGRWTHFDEWLILFRSGWNHQPVEVENHLKKMKGNHHIGDTPILHWTMIMGVFGYTTQLYMGITINTYKNPLLKNQYFMERKPFFFSWLSFSLPNFFLRVGVMEIKLKDIQPVPWKPQKQVHTPWKITLFSGWWHFSHIFWNFHHYKLGKMISYFDDHIFRMGWFKHQLEWCSIKRIEGLGSDLNFFRNCWGKLPIWRFRESTPRKTNMSPENPWLEDVFSIKILPS